MLPPELGSLPVEALVEGPEIYYAPTVRRLARSKRRGRRTLLVGIDAAALPEVEKEIAFLRRRLRGARVLSGAAATRDEVLRSLSGSRLVHLAGHAQSRADLPLLSALRLRDGWLTASDLAGVDLESALVVLSACRTGDPSLRWRGEALAGFPRALLAAGAAALVASRWEVSDAVAHRWMRHFHSSLAKLPPDRALAEAARHVRERFPHPADWAAFLLIRGGSL